MGLRRGLRSGFVFNFLQGSRFFSRSLRWDRQRVLDYENAKLREVVRHAGTAVRYYRELFRNIGLDPTAFRGIQDIHRIPFLDKESIRRNPEAFLADQYRRMGGRWHKTSGSTGTPLRLWIDDLSNAYKYAATIRGYQQAGYHFGSKCLIIQGYSARYKAPFGYRVLSNSLYFNAVKNSEKTFLEFYPLLMRHRPRFFLGYTRAVAQMCRYMSSNHLQLPKVVAMVNYGEGVPTQDISYVCDALKCRYVEFYSNTENSAMMHTMWGGPVCLIEDFFFPEVFDGSGRLVTTGEGELISTSFYNYAMPLIRYKTRDIVSVSAGTYAGFRCVDRVVGRANDKIVLPDGTEILFAEDALSLGKGKVIAAQYIQESRDQLAVNVVVEDGFDPSSFLDMEKLLRERLGDSLRYTFKVVTRLEERGDGKTPFMISRLESRGHANSNEGP